MYENDGSIYAICSFQVPEVANCSVQHTTDYTYNNLSPPIIGHINVPFVIAPLAAITTAVYYHQVTLLVNATFRIVIRSRETFITTDNMITPKATTHHISSTFPSDVTPSPSAFPLGIVGGISGALLVALALSMAVNVMFIFKSKHFYKGCLIYTIIITISTSSHYKMHNTYQVRSIRPGIYRKFKQGQLAIGQSLSNFLEP